MNQARYGAASWRGRGSGCGASRVAPKRLEALYTAHALPIWKPLTPDVLRSPHVLDRGWGA
jgi:hypothetical protein